MAYDALNSQTPRAVFIGAGTRGPFSFQDSLGDPIRVRVQSHVFVRRFANTTDEVGTPLVLNTDYTVNNTDVDAVSITLASGQAVLASTERLVVERRQDIFDVIALSSGGDFSGPTLAAAISVLVEELQELRRDVDRKVGAPTLDANPPTIPLKANMAGKVLMGGNDGNIIGTDLTRLAGSDLLLGSGWALRLAAGSDWATLKTGDTAATAQELIDAGKSILILPECDGISLAGLVIKTGTHIWAPKPIRIVANDTLFKIGTTAPTTDWSIDLSGSLVDMRTAADPASSVCVLRTSLERQWNGSIKNFQTFGAFAAIRQDVDNANFSFNIDIKNILALCCRGAPYRSYNIQGYFEYNKALADFTDQDILFRGEPFLTAGTRVAKSFFGHDFGGATPIAGITVVNCGTFGKGSSGSSGSPGGMKLRNIITPIIRGYLADSLYGVGNDWKDIYNLNAIQAEVFGASDVGWKIDNMNNSSIVGAKYTGTVADSANADGFVMINSATNMIDFMAQAARRRSLVLGGFNTVNTFAVNLNGALEDNLRLDNSTASNTFNHISGQIYGAGGYNVRGVSGGGGTPSCDIAASIFGGTVGQVTGLTSLEVYHGQNNDGVLKAVPAYI